MNIRMRLGIVFLIICALALEIYAGLIDREEARRANTEEVVAKDTITLWYTDETLTDFLNSVALTYYENTDVHVNLQLVSGLEYLETINNKSVRGEDYPDLYIVGNDSLGKAYLSGLACEIKDEGHVLSDDYYCKAALDAVTYSGKYVAYPMYFETSYFLYNKTYLREIAQRELLEEWLSELPEDAVEAQAGDQEGAQDAAGAQAGDQEGAQDAAAGEDSLEERILSDPAFLEELEARTKEMVPHSIDGILDFADRYDAPENVTAIFKWDVSDIFYNYFFAGNYVNIGGAAGDDPKKIDIYNESAIRCMNIYQDLNQFFSIDAETSSYASVLQEFIEGKMIFTLATTDAIATLEAAKADGTFAYEYGVALIPSLTEELGSKEVSVTTAVAINGYSDKKSAANVFARYICTTFADMLYARTGKVSARRYVPYENDAFSVIGQAYELSVPMPKVVESSNFWVELEMCFTNIWTGDDANLALKKLSEQIREQITGEEYREEYIEVIEETEIYEDAGMEE